MANLGQRVPVGTGVVLKRDGHVLVGKRKGSFGAGMISLPGGKPDGGEAPDAAAMRELKEETGIEIRHGYYNVLPVWTYDIDREAQIHYVTVYFVADCPPDAHAQLLEPDKCVGWYWARPEDLYYEHMFHGAAKAIQAAFPGEHLQHVRYNEYEEF